MKTLIAIPCMDMVHTQFLRSILGMRAIGVCEYSLTQSSLIYDARNLLAAKAVNEGFHRVLWLDSDMIFDTDLMERLSARLDEGYDFVSGLYFTRRDPVRPVLFKSTHVEVLENGTRQPKADYYYDYPKDSLFEIAAVGFGAVMMTVDLIREVGKLGLPFSPRLGFGEDLTFCRKVEGIGKKMWCDSSIKLGHIGYKQIDESLYGGGPI